MGVSIASFLATNAPFTASLVKGQGNVKIVSQDPGNSQLEVTCPNDHKTLVAPQLLTRFAWGGN
jgi:hypothetical protein